MSITVYARIDRSTEVVVDARSGNSGKYVVLDVGGLTLFINSRGKALEIASLLEKASQKCDDENDQ